MSPKILKSIVLWAMFGVLISGNANAGEGLSLSGSASTEDGADANVDATPETDDGEEAGVTLYRPTHDKFNLHLGVGFVLGLGDDFADENYENMGVQGLVGFDVVLKEPLALSFQGGFNSFVAGDQARSLTSAFVGAGFRLRFFADTNGALSEGGTAAGNLWLDAHFDYFNHIYEDHGGYDVGLGYEFALFKNINMGPYVKFMHVAFGEGVKYMAVSGGLAISIAGDTEPGDMDMDGIVDDMDECPKQPEDKDSFEDEDGCPEADNDEDGILDGDDECPETAGIPEKNGCPETDNDKDGIENDSDLCPDEAEDKDDFEDEDGCPEADNDKDGIADSDDMCVMEPEDKDGFEDEDGCPDTDNDKDGILDADDQCPNEAETKNGQDDEDGCPDLVRVKGDQIQILQKVHFATGKATILEDSHELLNQVSAVIQGKPDIRVRVEGHTDDVGKDAKNLKLSQDRADSVKAFLVAAGIEESRLVSEGKGETTPIADNKTKEGRAENRRVEFHIIRPEAAAPAKEEAAPAEKEAEATPEE
ncbi:MAG: OmpA family protein [Deltaproteobacteria bacterium]|nr:OmpA family protein [Deltaproteobacteria bacterium]MBN2674275.1 OmpA family protein [Deltaproteobacteria bacterium]